MTEGALALALGAGMLAAVNPCGFALLPAYLSLLVLRDEPTSGSRAVTRALQTTALMTLGFTAVFAVFGLLVAPVASSVQRYLPWFTIVLGLTLVILGGWVSTGRTLPGIGRRTGRSNPVTRTPRSMVGFGASYALASLTCTIAPFLAVVVAAFRAESVWTGAALFLVYAAGMGLVVGTAAVAVALARTSLVHRLRRLGRGVPMLSGVLLLLAGGYVAYYGWWEIRVLDGAAADDPVIEAAADVQRWLATAVDQVGAVGFVLVLAALVGSGLLTGLARRRRRASVRGRV